MSIILNRTNINPGTALTVIFAAPNDVEIRTITFSNTYSGLNTVSLIAYSSTSTVNSYLISGLSIPINTTYIYTDPIFMKTSDTLSTIISYSGVHLWISYIDCGTNYSLSSTGRIF